MGIPFPKIALWGVCFLGPFMAQAGGEHWFFFRPPELDFVLPSLTAGPPGDDDSGGSSSEEIEPEDGWLWHNWGLLRFFAQGGDDNTATSENVTGVSEIDDDSMAQAGNQLRLIPAFRTNVNRENLVDFLMHYLWLGLGWQEMEDEGIDLIYPECLNDVLPYLRLYDYEPQHPAWIDPEFIYYFIEQETVITERLSGLKRALYLAARARWMDAFMGPEDALQAWGELAHYYAESSRLCSVIERLLHLPWQESAWVALSECIGGIENGQLQIVLARLIYARFRVVHGQFRFSACMPWLLVLPGILDEERIGIRNYLYMLICEQAGRDSFVLNRVHTSMLSLLSIKADADVWNPFFCKLFDDNIYEGNASGYLFLLRVFNMLDSGEDLEMSLLNKVSLLLYEKGSSLGGEGVNVLEELVALMKEGMLSEKGYQFCLELLCAPCPYSREIETLRMTAIGSLLSFQNLENTAFKRLWKIYYQVLRSEFLPVPEEVFQTLPSVICSPHLSQKMRRLLFYRLNNEEAFDGAYVINLLLNTSAPEAFVIEGLQSLVRRIERQPSDAFWNVVKGRLPDLLSLLWMDGGHFKQYYDRIIDALNALTKLKPDRCAENPILMQLREEAIEILLSHYTSLPCRTQEIFMMLKGLSIHARDAAYVEPIHHAYRLWRWLFVQDVLDNEEVEASIHFLLDFYQSADFVFIDECRLLSSALVVPLSCPSLSLELRVKILTLIYKGLDLRSAVTLLLKGVSWVQDAKILYGLSQNVAQCTDVRTLGQVRAKLIYSGYLRHRIQQAFTVRHCDAVALRFLHAAKQLLNTLRYSELMDDHLEARVSALRTITGTAHLYPELAEAAASLLERLAKTKLISPKERVFELVDDNGLQK